MLTYHQAFDIYHTAFRILKILSDNPNTSFEKERLRIFDFLILFPHELKDVQVPAGAGSYKFKFPETKYNSIPNKRRLFIQLGKYFNTSLSCLLSYGMIDLENFKDNKIILKSQEQVNKLIDSNDEPLSIEKDITIFLKQYFLKMNLTELKRRTGLIEYRYDLLENK